MSYGSGNSSDDLRSGHDRYSYFIRGRKIVILEWKSVVGGTDYANEPEYQPPSASSDELTDANEGKTGIDNGLMLQFTAIPEVEELLTENDLLPVNDILALAMVDYIKAQLIEDPKNQAKQVYYLQKFKDRIAKYNSRKVGGVRTVVGTKFMNRSD